MMGLLIAVVVTSAGLQDDAAGAVGELFRRMWWRCSQRLRVIWADQMYEGSAVLWARAIGGWVLDIVRRPPGAKGFQLLPKRWVVERTFAWLGRYRINSKEYERLTDSSEAQVYVSSVKMLLNRLVPPPRSADFHYHRSAA